MDIILKSILQYFWNDSVVAELSINNKLLYLYLCTSKHISSIGLSSISLDIIANESKLSKAVVKKGVDALSKAGLLVQDNEHLLLIDYIDFSTRLPMPSSLLKSCIHRIFLQYEACPSALVQEALRTRYPGLFLSEDNTCARTEDSNENQQPNNNA